MPDLLTEAQLVMLAQTLDVPPERVSHLARLGADNVRALRERISDVLFDAHAETFRRVSALGPLVPTALVAKVAEAVIPPLVGGRAGGAIGVDHPEKAVGVLSRVSPGYAADAAPYLDPRAVKQLAAKMPAGPLIPAAKELLARKDYVTAARFVEFATPELIRAFEAALDDDEGVLRVASYTHSDERLCDIVRTLPLVRVASLITTAANATAELQMALISLVSRLDDELRREVGDLLFSELDDPVLTKVIDTVVANDAKSQLMAIVDAVDEPVRRRVTALLEERDDS